MMQAVRYRSWSWPWNGSGNRLPFTVSLASLRCHHMMMYAGLLPGFAHFHVHDSEGHCGPCFFGILQVVALAWCKDVSGTYWRACHSVPSILRCPKPKHGGLCGTDLSKNDATTCLQKWERCSRLQGCGLPLHLARSRCLIMKQYC